jgi:uncharacterized CHY-type Zn-finger protein
MELDIKCMDCNKQTRNYEIGRLFYVLEKPKIRALVEKQIICPKCRKDISNEKFMIKESQLMWSLITANICKQIDDVPSHLEGVTRIDERGYDIMKEKCKSIPNLVEKF